jgi:hypothetical protein
MALLPASDIRYGAGLVGFNIAPLRNFSSPLLIVMRQYKCPPNHTRAKSRIMAPSNVATHVTDLEDIVT